MGRQPQRCGRALPPPRLGQPRWCASSAPSRRAAGLTRPPVSSRRSYLKLGASRPSSRTGPEEAGTSQPNSSRIRNPTATRFTSLHSPHVVNRYLYTSLSYDPVTDFAPVTLICLYPMIMVVPNTSPARSVNEFIAYAKANKLSYASAGYGTSLHLAGELFKRRNITGLHPAAAEITGKRLQILLEVAPDVRDQKRSAHSRWLPLIAPRRRRLVRCGSSFCLSFIFVAGSHAAALVGAGTCASLCLTHELFQTPHVAGIKTVIFHGACCISCCCCGVGPLRPRRSRRTSAMCAGFSVLRLASARRSISAAWYVSNSSEPSIASLNIPGLVRRAYDATL